jgi:hypothetical protein
VDRSFFGYRLTLGLIKWVGIITNIGMVWLRTKGVFAFALAFGLNYVEHNGGAKASSIGNAVAKIIQLDIMNR